MDPGLLQLNVSLMALLNVDSGGFFLWGFGDIAAQIADFLISGLLRLINLILTGALLGLIQLLKPLLTQNFAIRDPIFTSGDLAPQYSPVIVEIIENFNQTSMVIAGGIFTLAVTLAGLMLLLGWIPEARARGLDTLRRLVPMFPFALGNIWIFEMLIELGTVMAKACFTGVTGDDLLTAGKNAVAGGNFLDVYGMTIALFVSMVSIIVVTIELSVRLGIMLFIPAIGPVLWILLATDWGRGFAMKGFKLFIGAIVFQCLAGFAMQMMIAIMVNGNSVNGNAADSYSNTFTNIPTWAVLMGFCSMVAILPKMMSGAGDALSAAAKIARAPAAAGAMVGAAALTGGASLAAQGAGAMAAKGGQAAASAGKALASKTASSTGTIGKFGNKVGEMGAKVGKSVQSGGEKLRDSKTLGEMKDLSFGKSQNHGTSTHAKSGEPLPAQKNADGSTKTGADGKPVFEERKIGGGEAMRRAWQGPNAPPTGGSPPRAAGASTRGSSNSGPSFASAEGSAGAGSGPAPSGPAEAGEAATSTSTGLSTHVGSANPQGPLERTMKPDSRGAIGKGLDALRTLKRGPSLMGVGLRMQKRALAEHSGFGGMSNHPMDDANLKNVTRDIGHNGPKPPERRGGGGGGDGGDGGRPLRETRRQRRGGGDEDDGGGDESGGPAEGQSRRRPASDSDAGPQNQAPPGADRSSRGGSADPAPPPPPPQDSSPPSDGPHLSQGPPPSREHGGRPQPREQQRWSSRSQEILRRRNLEGRTWEEVRQALKQNAKRTHPDITGSSDAEDFRDVMSDYQDLENDFNESSSPHEGT